MHDTETLSRSNPKPSLQDLLTRTRGTAQSPVTQHRRRAEDRILDASSGIGQDTIRLTQGSDVVLEPVASRQPYDLSYAFLLIPRFSAHYLIGDIAESLRDWMQRICISFSWRLEEISVRPEYMQWVLYVPANTPPSRCVRNIRQQTSIWIFEDFPHIRQENISQDFWAPGYRVLVGPTPHPAEMINEYIQLTRQQQGPQPRLRD